MTTTLHESNLDLPVIDSAEYLQETMQGYVEIGVNDWQDGEYRWMTPEALESAQQYRERLVEVQENDAPGSYYVDKASGQRVDTQTASRFLMVTDPANYPLSESAADACAAIADGSFVTARLPAAGAKRAFIERAMSDVGHWMQPENGGLTEEQATEKVSSHYRNRLALADKAQDLLDAEEITDVTTDESADNVVQTGSDPDATAPAERTYFTPPSPHNRAARQSRAAADPTPEPIIVPAADPEQNAQPETAETVKPDESVVAAGAARAAVGATVADPSHTPDVVIAEPDTDPEPSPDLEPTPDSEPAVADEADDDDAAEEDDGYDYETDEDIARYRQERKDKITTFINRVRILGQDAALGFHDARKAAVRWAADQLPTTDNGKKGVQVVALGVVAVGVLFVGAKLSGMLEGSEEVVAGNAMPDVTPQDGGVPIPSFESATPDPVDPPLPPQAESDVNGDTLVAELKLDEDGKGVEYEVRQFLTNDADGFTYTDRLLAPELTATLLEQDPNLQGVDPTAMAKGTTFDVTADLLEDARARIGQAHEEIAQAAGVPATPDVYQPEDAAGSVTLQRGAVDTISDMVAVDARQAGVNISDADTLELAYRRADYNHIPRDELNSLSDGRIIFRPPPHVEAQWLHEIQLEREATLSGN